MVKPSAERWTVLVLASIIIHHHPSSFFLHPARSLDRRSLLPPPGF